MGELMALALVCTMAAAVLFQPALMGRPREQETWDVRRDTTVRVPTHLGLRPQSSGPRSEHALAGARVDERRPEHERRHGE